MSYLDRVIEKIFPETGLKRSVAREKLRILNSGYSNGGANHVKKSMRSWNYRGGSPDEDITRNLTTLRERSRDLYMNAPIAAGALKTYRSNVIGEGLKLKSTIDADFLEISKEDAKELEKSIEREFSLWSKECDAARKMDFYEIQRLVFLSHMMSGDVFCTLPMIGSPRTPYGLRINVIEADRVCNPPNVPETIAMGGVKIDKYGAPISYYISKNHPLNTVNMTYKADDWDEIRAFGKESGRRNVLHILDSERPGQRRGVPVLAPVIETLKQLTRYTDAELMNALVSSLFTIFITTEEPDKPPIGEGIPKELKVASSEENALELAPGQVVTLGQGEDVKQANPSRQNNAFDGFITTLVRQIGTGIEIPHELLIKHFTSSYSASRAALLEAWRTFKTKRSFMINKFCNPIFEEFLTESILLGRINAPGFFDDPAKREAYLKCEWYGTSQGQLDPLKEAKAAEVRVVNGFSSRTREAAELTGSDFETISKLRIEEERIMREGGVLYDSQGPILDDEELQKLINSDE